MAFFCPIFPKTRTKAKEYEDSNYFSFDGRGLYSPRSMTALNHQSPSTDEKTPHTQDFNNDEDDDDRSSSIIGDRSIFDTMDQSISYVITNDFEPTVDDELAVRCGDVVKIQYRDREWVYVLRRNRAYDDRIDEGFVPSAYCREIDRSSKSTNGSSSIFKNPFGRKSNPQDSKDDAIGPPMIIDSIKTTDQSQEIDTDRSNVSSDHGHRLSTAGSQATRAGQENRLSLDQPGDSVRSKSAVSDRSINSGNGDRKSSKSSIREKALMNVDRFLRSLDEDDRNKSIVVVDEHQETIGRPPDNYAKIDKTRKTTSDRKIDEHESIDQCQTIPKSVVSKLADQQRPVDPKPNGPKSIDQTTTASSSASSISDVAIEFGSISEFTKRNLGRIVVEYDFDARNEDDTTVRRGDTAMLLNEDDPDWYWIRRDSDGAEGFVPSTYVKRFETKASMSVAATVPDRSTSSDSRQQQSQSVQFNELMVIADFEPEAADDLRVIKGDWIYSYQTNALQDQNWLWAYCPRTKRYGFVPNSIVRTPASTVL